MKKVIPILFALFFILNITSCSNVENNKPIAERVTGFDLPIFSVYVNGIEITQDSVAGYPIYSVEAKSVNSSGTESTVTYVGLAVKDILKAAGLNESYVWLEATASDGYTVTLKGDVIYEDTTLLAMTKDGSPFAVSPWLAPCSDTVTGNYLKGTASILVSTTENAPDIKNPETTAAAGLPEIQDRTEKIVFEPYSFLVNGTEITNATLANLKIFRITAVTVNKEGKSSEAAYSGYKLADVLDACGLKNYTKVTAIANDGYKTELKNELIASEYTLLAIEKDKESGAEGTVWLAPCSETASNVYCKLVVEIVAE